MKIPRNPFAEENEELKIRHSYLLVVVVFFFLLLVVRLWYLQILRGAEFRAESENNRTRLQETLPPRGLILDRHDNILVDNSPSYEVAVIREDIKDPEFTVDRLSYLLGKPWYDLRNRFEEIRKKPAFQPAVLYTGLSRESLVAIESHRYELPGVHIQVRPRRRYHHDFLASHVIGYMGEINKKQLEDRLYENHRMGDQVGQYGVERTWEHVLHGQRGSRLVEVNATGRVLNVIREISPTPGRNVHLTIDSWLQKVAQEALEDQVGAIVALDPTNGDVLALASTPGFSKKDFEGGIGTAQWRKLVENPLHPLDNRAISGQYPPGSTFKLVSAAAALEEGAADMDTRVTCSGKIKLGDRDFHCWKKSGHGQVDFHRALKESCDVFFYEMALRIGVDRLAEYARAFGLGEKTGIPLPAEASGLVPTKAWKKRRYNMPWRMGESLTVVIGQGYLLTTPLQMARVTSVVANGGTLYRPRLVRKITDATGHIEKFYQPEVQNRLNFKPHTFEYIREGLSAVVNEPGGTGSRARLEKIQAGGKTGTAQVVTLKRSASNNLEDPPYKYRDHAWFVAFAPVEAPRIAVAVVVEHAGSGATEAAPIAKRVMEAFFDPDRPYRLPSQDQDKALVAMRVSP